MARIVLIVHSGGPIDDRVVTYFKSKGFDPEILRPFAGDQLGILDSSVIATVVYGGSFDAMLPDENPFLHDESAWIRQCIDQNVPLLGLCLGGQLIARVLGAEIGPKPDGIAEFGYYEINPTEAGKDYFPASLFVPQAHYHEFQLPQGAELLASSDSFKQQAFKYGNSTFAFQFHPEVTKNSFRRWQQEETWTREHRLGVQTREQQHLLMDEHDPTINDWFMEFLDGLFGDALERARKTSA